MVRFDLAGGSQADRKLLVLGFIERSYEKTSHFSKDYVVAGVDYLGFREMYIYFQQACTVSQLTIDEIAKSLAGCSANERCYNQIRVGFEIQKDSWIIGRQASYEIPFKE